MRYIYCLIIFLFSFLGGSAIEQPDAHVPNRVVTQIHIDTVREGQTLRRTYTEPEEMETVLNYLRQLDPYHKADIDPDTFRSGIWCIEVCYSDGSSTVYRQLHRDYLQKDNGNWRQIQGEDDLLFLFS